MGHAVGRWGHSCPFSGAEPAPGGGACPRGGACPTQAFRLCPAVPWGVELVRDAAGYLRGILSQVLKAQPATGHRLRGPLSKQEPELEGLGNSRPLRKAEVSQHVRGGQRPCAGLIG